MTMKKIVQDLQKDGWKIEYGPANKGYYTDRGAKKVVVNSHPGDPAKTVQQLSHEGGHAASTPDPYVPPDGLTKEQYVKRNVDGKLKNEGEATMTNAQVRQEIKDNGGPDIGIAGKNAKK